MTVIQTLASLLSRMNHFHNSREYGMVANMDAQAIDIIKNRLPHGSGFDNGVFLNYTKSMHPNECIVFNTSFHHMNENGFYDGWTEHTITVKACFYGLDITVSGQNKNDIKGYIEEQFYYALMEEMPKEAK